MSYAAPSSLQPSLRNHFCNGKAFGTFLYQNVPKVKHYAWSLEICVYMTKASLGSQLPTILRVASECDTAEMCEMKRFWRLGIQRFFQCRGKRGPREPGGAEKPRSREAPPKPRSREAEKPRSREATLSRETRNEKEEDSNETGGTYERKRGGVERKKKGFERKRRDLT